MLGENKIIAVIIGLSLVGFLTLRLLNKIGGDIAAVTLLSTVALFALLYIWHRPKTNAVLDRHKTYFFMINFFGVLLIFLETMIVDALGNEALLALPLIILGGVGLTLLYENWDDLPGWQAGSELLLCLAVLFAAVFAATTAIRPFWLAGIVVALPVAAGFLGRQWYYYQRWLQKTK